MKKEEKALQLLIAEGDEEAFSRLFYQYMPVLQPFILKFTRSQTAAEEIIQETFIRIWLSREKLETVDNLRAWLFRFASNECLNYLRKQLLENRVMDEIADPREHGTTSTADKVSLSEVQRLLDEAIGRLPPQRQRIYRMSRVQGMKIKEIALTLGISPNTVKNALVTSLKSIRDYLALSGYVFSFLLAISSALF